MVDSARGVVVEFMVEEGRVRQAMVVGRHPPLRETVRMAVGQAVWIEADAGELFWRRPGGGAVIKGTLVNCDVAAGRCSRPFGSRFADEIANAYPKARFTASVHDHRTGCSYGLNPGLEVTTASVIKAQVLAGLLLQAQDAGRPLTAGEAEDITLMMQYSHNAPPASRLYAAVGGAAGMESIDGRFGISGTIHRDRYGATLSTARDRTVLVEQLLTGGGPLGEAAVSLAWTTMSEVTPVQSWGITAGLPTGHQAALKNGFYPSRLSGWRVGTTGVVRDPHGGTYAVTVLTDRNPTESAGISLVEAITRRINAALTAGRPSTRSPEVCVESPRSWSEAASMLGNVDPEELRRHHGGEAEPLAGQRVCQP